MQHESVSALGMSGLKERREEADERDGFAVSGEVDGPQPALVLLLERQPAAAAALRPLPLHRLTRALLRLCAGAFAHSVGACRTRLARAQRLRVDARQALEEPRVEHQLRGGPAVVHRVRRHQKRAVRRPVQTQCVRSVCKPNISNIQYLINVS